MRREFGTFSPKPIIMKKYSLQWPNLEFNIEFNAHFLALCCSWKWGNELWLNYWLDFEDFADSCDILQIQYEDVDKQQLLSIVSISNNHFMKMFPPFIDKSSYSLLRKVLRIFKSRFKYQNQSAACISCCSTIIIISP